MNKCVAQCSAHCRKKIGKEHNYNETISVELVYHIVDDETKEDNNNDSNSDASLRQKQIAKISVLDNDSNNTVIALHRFQRRSRQPRNIESIRYLVSLACNEIITIYEPIMAHQIFEYFCKMSLILSITKTNNYENVKYRIVYFSRFETSFMVELLYYCLGFCSTDDNMHILICNQIRQRQFYLEAYDIIHCYLSWFDKQYQYYSLKATTTEISFNTFLNRLNIKTTQNNFDTNFNTIKSMKKYIESNKFPNRNKEENFSTFTNWCCILLDVLYTSYTTNILIVYIINIVILIMIGNANLNLNERQSLGLFWSYVSTHLVNHLFIFGFVAHHRWRFVYKDN